MKAEFINPFLESTKKVIETMAFTEVEPGQPAVKTDNLTWGTVTGIIGLASEKLTGTMLVSFEADSILAIVSNMLGEEFKEVNEEVVDAVGEITNMISGQAKKIFSEQGYSFDMAVPVMVKGENVEITQLSGTPGLRIPFSTASGHFVVEAVLKSID